jgi:hypothetical protein
MQVPVDAVEVDEVELFERVSIALLRALDEPADVFRRLAPGALLGRRPRYPGR